MRAVNIFSALSSSMNAAVKATKAVAGRLWEPIRRLISFILEYFPRIFQGGWQTYILLIAVITAAAVLGVGSVMVFLQDDEPNPLASPTSSGGTAIPTGSATLPPSPRATAPAASGTSTPTATPAPMINTYRGEIDVTAVRASGLTIGEHSIEILVFEDFGAVEGSYTLTFEQFPIGALLAAVFGAANDPDWAQFETCTVRLILPAVLSGSYDRTARAISGDAVIVPVSEDPTGCLATRPSNVSLDSVEKPSTVAWRATLDGRLATGAIVLNPELPFTATLVD